MSIESNIYALWAAKQTAKGTVAYSLGDFVFDRKGDRVILWVTIQAKHVNAKFVRPKA